MPSFEEIPDLGWEPEVLQTKERVIKRDALIGLVVGLIGLMFFGILLGAYAVYSGRDALTNINVYGVGRNYRWVAHAAQIIGVLAMLYWIVSLIVGILRAGSMR
jgi:MFS superfamily sulfate permease-like transporter